MVAFHSIKKQNQKFNYRAFGRQFYYIKIGIVIVVLYLNEIELATHVLFFQV